MDENFLQAKENAFYDRKALKILPQTGKRVSMPRDKGRPASLPGKRISRNGKTYWESRKNRSDQLYKKI